MINIKPKIYGALNNIPGINVNDEYPSDWSKFPIITYIEEDNSTYSIHDDTNCFVRNDRIKKNFLQRCTRSKWIKTQSA